jgi:hypothetical protein
MHVMPIYFLLAIEVARVKDLRDAVSQLGVAGTAVDREYVLVRLKENVERAIQHQPVLDRGQGEGERPSEAVATGWIRDRKATGP